MACIPDDELQRLEQTVALERLEESRESRDRAQAPRRDLGSGYSEFDLESECVDGKKAIVHVEGVWPGVGAGIPKLPIIASERRGEISFEDDLSSINPDVFDGAEQPPLGVLVRDSARWRRAQRRGNLQAAVNRFIPSRSRATPASTGVRLFVTLDRSMSGDRSGATCR